MERLNPPALFFLLLPVMAAVGFLAPIAGPIRLALRLLGLGPMAAGLGLAFGGSRHFERVGTEIETFGHPTTLVTDGLFSRSRNPMYLGFVLFLGGLATLIGSVSAWIGPAIFVGAAQRWYVPHEEATMTDTFGPDYVDYQRRVPRWIGRPRP